VSAEDNRALLDRYMQAVWVEANPEAITDFVSADYRRYGAPGAAPLDIAGQIERIRGFRAAFPDITVVLDDVIADDHGVAFRSTMQGTHLGDFAGVAGTGRSVLVQLVDFMEIRDGAIVAQWGGPDMHDLMRQLA
jgi:predicted ester cyclase